MSARRSWLASLVGAFLLVGCGGGTSADAGAGGGSGGGSSVGGVGGGSATGGGTATGGGGQTATGGGAAGGGEGGGAAGGGGGSMDAGVSSATKLTFLAPSLVGVAGQPLGPSLQVRVEDAQGDLVADSTASVTLALVAGPTGAQLGGTQTVQASGGVATFSNVSLTLAGQGYVLRASSAGLVEATSASFDVIPGVPSKLVFIDQPASPVSVRASLGQVQVAVLDFFDNRTTSSPAVTLSAPGLVGTLTQSAVSGVATFDDLSVTLEDTGLTLQAASTGLFAGVSARFTVVDDVPPTRPTLMQDAATTSAITVSWAAVGDDGLLGALTSQQLRHATSPIVTDADFLNATPVTTGAPKVPGQLDSAVISGLQPATNYFVALAVTDSAGNTVRATLAASTQTANVSQLAFTSQPTNGTAGQSLSTVRVALQDAAGVTVLTATTAVTLTVPSVAGFTPVTVNAVAGVATFSALRVDVAGTGYQLRASAGSLPPVLSASFAVGAGPASTFTLTGLPASLAAGASSALQLTARDAFGNVAASYAGTVSFSSSDPSALLPPNSTFSVGEAGVKSISGVELRTAGAQSITVQDTATAALAATVSATVTPASAASLELIGVPTSLPAGGVLSLQVRARDAFGNLATGYRGTVAFTSTDPAALLPNNVAFVAADNGVRAFGLQLRTAGARTITVTDTAQAALTSTRSTTVLPAALAALGFSTQPANGRVRVALGTVRVELRDTYGNAVSATSPAITLALASGGPSSTLSGTLTASPVAGVATFTGLSLDQEGTGFRLLASATGLPNATSAAFNVVDDLAPEAPFIAAVQASATSVVVSWIAVGDDGVLGVAASTELRSAATPITNDAEFVAGTLFTTPTPGASGTLQSVTVTGLTLTGDVYFALKAFDSAGNSSRSNTARVSGDPCLGVTCLPPAPTCSADGRSAVSSTSTCVSGSCQSTPLTVLCASSETCVAGACAPVTAGSQTGRVIISEFRALGAEFIELRNTTAASLDVAGFTLRNAAGTEVDLRAPTDPSGGSQTPVLIPAGGVLYGVANPSGAAPGGVGFLYGAPGTSFSLADTGDALALYAKAGALEDAVDFRTFVTDPNTPLTANAFVGLAGSSTQLEPTSSSAAGNDGAASWCVSFFPQGGPRTRVTDTAGVINGSCKVAVINELVVDAVGADDAKTFIELAGPGGSFIGGARVVDVEGLGATAGQNNSAGEFIIPAGTRFPADGILLLADSATSTTLVPGVVAGVDLLGANLDYENGGGDSVQLISALGVLLDALGHSVAGANLDTNTSATGLVMYEGATALYAPVAASLARAPLSTDTDSNRNDFRADPTPTPGVANDAIAVTVSSLFPSDAVASLGVSSSITITGTDLASGLRATFGAAPPVNCTFISSTQATCGAPPGGSVVARVNVVFSSPASVGAPDVTLPAAFTYTGVLNGTVTNEADYCAVVAPSTLAAAAGATTDLVYVQVYEAGATEPAGPTPGLRVSVGLGTLNTSPLTTANWRFFPAAFNPLAVNPGNNDEFMGALVAPTASGTSSYAGRVSFDDGFNWTYCDLNGAGANSGLLFETTQLGVLTVP